MVLADEVVEDDERLRDLDRSSGDGLASAGTWSLAILSKKETIGVMELFNFSRGGLSIGVVLCIS